jgi:hypothetical protein
VKKRIIWTGPIIGALGIGTLCLIFANLTPAYIIWALLNLFVFEIPFGALLGLIPGLIWWFVLRGVEGDVHKTIRLSLASFLGGLGLGVISWLLWAALPFLPGPPWLAALTAFLVATMVFTIVGHRSIKSYLM